jgi:hypothetical protein
VALSDYVQISITTETSSLQQAGFGTPIVLAGKVPAGFTERVREYTATDDMVTDGFSAKSPEVLAVGTLLSQSVRPVSVLVGRLALPATQKFVLTPVAQNSTVYSGKLNGSPWTFTSDSTATTTEITTGLNSAIGALITAQSSGLVMTGTTALTLTQGTAGAFDSLSVDNPVLIGLAQTHTDPGSATDLANIALERDDWYGVISLMNSSAVVAAIAGYVEANTKLYLAQTQDTEVIIHALSGATDIAATLQAAARARTAVFYHPRTDAFLDAAIAGRCLPLTPGSETWALKTVSGPEVTNLTRTQRTNALAKNCNIYEKVAGKNVTTNGTCADGEFIDVVRGRDWLEARLAEDIFDALSKADKVPFDDGGISVIQGVMEAVLQEGVDNGLLSSNPKPKVTVPLASAVPDADKQARRLTGVKFDAVLAGAIHKAVIKGTLTL